MKYSAIWSLALFLAMTAFIACDKDDDDDDNNKTVYERSGLVLNGANEDPPQTTDATGTMNVHYDKGTKILMVTVNWTNLSADPVAAHIHGTAPKGVNAGVKVDFSSDVTTASGNVMKHVTVDEVAIKEDSLLAGFYYFNIHTPQHPGGEIRGQIEF
jgi:hypothetical protein